eukprot:COSAG02_NODE_914_length_15990_cov_9.617897_4_plen_92_part_00
MPTHIVAVWSAVSVSQEAVVGRGKAAQVCTVQGWPKYAKAVHFERMVPASVPITELQKPRGSGCMILLAAASAYEKGQRRPLPLFKHSSAR